MFRKIYIVENDEETIEGKTREKCIKHKPESWEHVEFVESKYLDQISGKNGSHVQKLQNMYKVKVKIQENKLWISGDKKEKRAILNWLRQFVLRKNFKLLSEESVTKKIFFIGLKYQDELTLELAGRHRDCVILGTDVSSKLREITFQNMPELKETCKEALLYTRNKVDTTSMKYICRAMVHTGKGYFANKPGRYTVQKLLNNPSLYFTCLPSKCIYFNKLRDLHLPIINKFIRFDLVIVNLHERFFMRYKVFLNVSSDGHISVKDIDSIDYENHSFYDLQTGPGYFFNLQKITAKIDIIDPTTCLTTRINIMLHAEDAEYEDNLIRHVEVLRLEGFFEKIKIAKESSGWELELPELPEGYYLYTFRRSEREHYRAESNSHILLLTKDRTKVTNNISNEGLDFIDMFFINNGLNSLFEFDEWSVDEALECIEKTLLYSSKMMKFILHV